MTPRNVHNVCPVWVGHLLANPIRKLVQNPYKIIAPYVTSGMHALDVGPGMGFFSLPMARRVGPSGRVSCVDVQERMIAQLTHRARRAGLADRIETRVCDSGSLCIVDLADRIDFALAFAVVHEVQDAGRLFKEIHDALKPGGRLLFAEPKGHVRTKDFARTFAAAQRNGLQEVAVPRIAGSHAVLLGRVRTPLKS